MAVATRGWLGNGWVTEYTLDYSSQSSAAMHAFHDAVSGQVKVTTSRRVIKLSKLLLQINTIYR